MKIYFLALTFISASALAVPPKASLYERLGGKKGVTSLASSFVDTISTDAQLMKNAALKKLEAKVDKLRIKSRLADELCKASGGPCKPSSKPVLENAPSQLHLEPMDWFSVLQDANVAMEHCHVANPERIELVNLMLQARNRTE